VNAADLSAMIYKYRRMMRDPHHPVHITSEQLQLLKNAGMIQTDAACRPRLNGSVLLVAVESVLLVAVEVEL